MSASRGGSREELFVVPDSDDSYYLYAPLRRVAASLNTAAVQSVSRFLSAGDSALEPADHEVIDRLRATGLFTQPAPDLPTSPVDYVFRPHEVTLFPTTRCNLRCIYCYANAGERQLEMPWEVARAAIELVIENARAVSRDDFIVGFHGGGEPTVAWGLVRRATLYARRRGRELGLDVKIHCASNGVLSPAQRAFVIDNLTGMNISLDGPADIQNRQRPLANGRGSFDRVVETIRQFQQAGFPYGIRVTLTESGGPRLSEIVRFVHDLCPELDQLHVEPVWQCGRCQTSGERPPSTDLFIESFAKAHALARRLGLRLFYSGARIDVLTNRFCAAPGEGFSVTPEGRVTSCFEVTDPCDPRSELFHYGRYDPQRRKFSIDRRRVERLRRLRVECIPHCRDCFCKWHCAGDCLAKALPGLHPEEHAGSPRCDLNREITRLELVQIARRSQAPESPAWKEELVDG